MNIKYFYSDKKRLSYNPSKTSSKRSGLRRLISYDDRFDEVEKTLAVIIGQSSKKQKLLDIGIGDGIYEKRFIKPLRKRVYITGVDISDEQLKRAGPYMDRGVLVNVDEDKLPFKDSSFDIVIISELLEHVFYPDVVLSQAFRVLRTGGYLVLTYPNAGAIQLRLALALAGRSPLLNYPENKEHIRFFGYNDIRKMTPKMKMVKYVGLNSFFFQRFNFPVKIVTPRCLEVYGNKYMKRLALGHLLVLQK